MTTDIIPQPSGTMAPGTLPERARPFLQAARAENTRKAYSKAWRAFEAFCATQHQSARPAEVPVVVDYLAHLAEAGKRPATIDQAAAAIGAAHQLSDCLDPTKDNAVRVLLAGIRRKLGTAPATKAAATRDELQRMVTMLPETLAGRRDRALLLLGYAGAFRRSELVSLDVADLRFGDQGLTVTLRRSKTDQEGAGTLKHVPALRRRELCPVAAVRAGFATQAAADGVDTLAIREVTGHKSDRMLARYVRSGGAQARQAVRRALGEEP